MKIKILEGQKIEELSMIEVAHAILEQKGEEMPFSDLVKEVQAYLNKSDEEMKRALSTFYTDLNTDGSFIPLGNNTWGLRSWYAIDSIDEETISLDYFDDEGKIKEEVIDDSTGVVPLETDDEETDAFSAKKLESITYDDDDDEDDEAGAYDAELAEVEVDADIPELEVVEIDEDLDDDDELENEERK
ncbi:MAG: DNA-directed RNA polymerase subunit delta [Streptococcaceae bacterium]|jgi:DNA-directed RNA polymerase subunit delta|nr:DNA-directed RNA polymerase subunit delta [Streptococcaceae bacterium]